MADGWRKEDLTYEWRDDTPIQINSKIVGPLAMNLGTADDAKPVINRLIGIIMNEARLTKFRLPKMTKTMDCSVTTSTGIYSCIRMQLTFFCYEGTKVKACYDENGALTFPRD